jgi:hypothetical protein
VKSRRLNTKSANVLENPLKKIYYYEITKLIGMGCNTLNPYPGSNLGYEPQNVVRIGLFTLKLDLLTAFAYTGFSVYGLFGRGAFRYTGFWVYGLFGSHP